MPLTTDDIVAINQLYARYNHAIDLERHKEFAATFTPDGTLNAMGTETTAKRR